MVGVFTFGLIFVLNHMEKLGAAHTTITYPSFWSFHTQGVWGKCARMNLNICLPGAGGASPDPPLLSCCKCSVQVFLCSCRTCVNMDCSRNCSCPLFFSIFVTTTQQKDELPPWILLTTRCSSQLLFAVFKTLLLYFGAECTLEVVPACWCNTWTAGSGVILLLTDQCRTFFTK